MVKPCLKNNNDNLEKEEDVFVVQGQRTTFGSRLPFYQMGSMIQLSRGLAACAFTH